MVVVCRSRQLLNLLKNCVRSSWASGDHCNAPNHRNFNSICNGLFIRHAHNSSSQFDYYNSTYRLYSHPRSYHGSKESRASYAKLSPQEHLYKESSGYFLSNECTTTGWSCYDCYTRKLCKGNRLWMTSKCKDTINANGVYCNPTINDCTAAEPEGCASVNPPRCSRKELYPNVNNCSQYFDCRNFDMFTMEQPELKSCGPLEYFHAKWGKCIFHTSAEACEPINCPSGVDLIKTHPIEPSFYYECKNGVGTLHACPEIGEIYDETLQACVTTCTWRSDGHIFGNAKNCTKYYMCKRNRDKLELIDYNCPNGTGFNNITQKCERDFHTLCNELSLLEANFELFLLKLPFGKTYYKLVELTMDIADYNPITLSLKLGLDQSMISDIIIVGDYIITSKAFPSTILSTILSKSVDYVPDELHAPVRSILELIQLPRSLSSAHYSLRHQTGERDTQIPAFPINFQYIARSLTDMPITVMFDELLQYFVHHLQLNDENLGEMYRILKLSMPDIIKFVNYNLEHDIFYVRKENRVAVDADNLFKMFDRKIIDIADELIANDAEWLAVYLYPILKFYMSNFVKGTREWVETLQF